jgi:predicted nucleic acid-binding Zn ribbon protein
MKKVEGMLGAALGRPEVLKAARAQIAMRKWEEIVGEALADKSTPDRYEKGTLWVVASGSAWAQEIRLRKEEIVSRLNEAAGEPGLFHEVRVGVRSFRVR